MRFIYQHKILFIQLSLLALVLLIGCETKHEPSLYMIGDSTMANKEKLYLPERGWGQLFPDLFTADFTIENHAKNGRSTRSFIYEGRWDSVYAKLAPGDFVIMQFGHNDGVETKIGRHATPEEYAYNLHKFIRETREKQAHAILATPIVRRRFDSTGVFYDTHGVYPDIVREIAKEEAVPLLEMHLRSMDLIKELGEEASKKIYLHYAPGEIDSLPNGKIDDTHFSEYGARTMAKIAAEELKIKVPELAQYLK